MRKVLFAFLVLICFLLTFSFYTVSVSADGIRTVYATTNESIKQGSDGYLYVYLDDLTDLSALNISVYYDAEKITVKNAYNQVSSIVNDITINNGCVKASYIFDGKGSATKTNIFYFYFQVNSTASIGDTYFDITVDEAYNSSLNEMDFRGSRCTFKITEKVVSKTCSVYSTSNLSTSIGEEFEVSYSLSTNQIASGKINIQYDQELFEIISAQQGGFLSDKITDINTDLNGLVLISFVSTSYQYNYDVITIRLRTIQNTTTTSEIKLVVEEFYDLDFNLYSCSGYATNVNVEFDETYIENAPKVSVIPTYNSATDQVSVAIKLDKDSMLGAGDFIFTFDTTYLTYNSSQKGFEPTFFNINYKNVENGILKFSIISLTDIIKEQNIINVVLDVKNTCQDKSVDFEINGNGLTDSLTNAIALNFVDASLMVPLKHTSSSAIKERETTPTCALTGKYDNVIYCSVCNEEISRETIIVEELGHEYKTEWTVDQEATCVEVGSKSHHCIRCDSKTDITEIAAKGHTEVVSKAVEPTCTTTGHTEGKRCSECSEVLVEQQEIPALGHSYGKDWKFDSTYHWRECECGIECDRNAHSFPVNNNAAICPTCGFTRGQTNVNLGCSGSVISTMFGLAVLTCATIVFFKRKREE